MLALSMTVPPSVNRCWANAPGRGRIKTAAYREWLTIAGYEIKPKIAGRAPIETPYILRIELSAPRYDIDNVVKPISDLLQTMGVVSDDKLMAELHVSRADRDRGVCVWVSEITV
jgi:Holliday junction resolvase RusA-like endonuclease